MDTDDILVVIGYRNDSTAYAARERLGVMGESDELTMDVAAVLIKDLDGELKVEHAQRRRGLFRRRRDDVSVDDGVAQKAGAALEPGQAALCLLVQQVSPEPVVHELSKYGGTVILTSLPPDREQMLREAIAQQMSEAEIATMLHGEQS